MRVPVLLAVLLAASPAVLLAPCGGLAQEIGAPDLEAPVEVFDLPRPQYDANGLPAGGFRIFPQLRVAETFDDNIFAAADDEEADLVTTTRAEIAVESQWSRHGMEVVTFVEDGRYLSNGDQNRQQYGVRPALEIEISDRHRLSGAAGYRREALGRSDADDLDDSEPTELNRFVAELDYLGSFNRVALGASARVERRDFIAPDDEARDRIEWRLAPTIGYEITPELGVFFSPFVLRRDFDGLDEDSLDRDAHLLGASAGLRAAVSPLVRVDLAVGAVYNVFEDPAFDDSLDLLIEASGDWYVTTLTTVKGRLSRRELATDQPGASARTESRIQAELQHELRHDFLLGLRLGYLRDAFRDTAREDHRARIELQARYLIDRIFSIGAGYRFEQRWSSDEDEAFRRNRLTLGLQAKF